MDQADQGKQREVMPNTLKRGIGKYFSREEGLSVSMKIMIIIAVFSLILIFIGTIILLNSYNPKATSLNSTQIRNYTQQKDANILIPNSTTKTDMLSLQSKLSDYTDTMTSDEANFESVAK